MRFYLNIILDPPIELEKYFGESNLGKGLGIKALVFRFSKVNNLDFKFNDTITFSLKSLRKRRLDFKLLVFLKIFTSYPRGIFSS